MYIHRWACDYSCTQSSVEILWLCTSVGDASRAQGSGCVASSKWPGKASPIATPQKVRSPKSD